MKLNWQDKDSVEKNINNEQIKQFLFHEGSLTQLIQQYCTGSFSVEVIAESWQLPIGDEAALLSLDNETSFIRKSLLKNNEQVLVYARTIIPKDTLTGKNEILTSLGEKPLGDVLFSDESTYRSEIRYAKIPVDCELHDEAIKKLNITTELWARQSLLYIEQKPLLITEIFLPAILECNKS